MSLETNTNVFFVDWNFTIFKGKEIGRTKDHVAIEHGNTITVIDKNRVFQHEIGCCHFILGELAAKYKTISTISDKTLERMKILPTEVKQ